MLSHSIRAFSLATAFTTFAVCAASTAQAASFDGQWSVLIITRSGPCDASYRFGAQIANGIGLLLRWRAGQRIRTRQLVRPSERAGIVGPQYAVGSGRLSRKFRRRNLARPGPSRRLCWASGAPAGADRS